MKIIKVITAILTFIMAILPKIVELIKDISTDEKK